MTKYCKNFDGYNFGELVINRQNFLPQKFCAKGSPMLRAGGEYCQ